MMYILSVLHAFIRGSPVPCHFYNVILFNYILPMEAYSISGSINCKGKIILLILCIQ